MVSRAEAVGRGQNVVRTFSPNLLDGMTSNFQNLLLRVSRFARFFFVRLSVCLSKILNIFVWFVWFES